jgi:hypothetical protein
MESPEGRNGYYVPLVYVVNPRPLVSNVCFKKTVTKHSYILLLHFVTVFFETDVTRQKNGEPVENQKIY